MWGLMLFMSRNLIHSLSESQGGSTGQKLALQRHLLWLYKHGSAAMSMLPCQPHFTAYPVGHISIHLFYLHTMSTRWSGLLALHSALLHLSTYIPGLDSQLPLHRCHLFLVTFSAVLIQYDPVQLCPIVSTRWQLFSCLLFSLLHLKCSATLHVCPRGMQTQILWGCTAPVPTPRSQLICCMCKTTPSLGLVCVL